MDGEPSEPLVQAPKPKTSRRLYITKRDLEKYGFTAGCPACDGVQIGRRSTGVHHTQLCQDRIEECLRKEDNPRVVRFEARQEEEATGLPQTVGVSVPKILYGYQSDRPYEVQGLAEFGQEKIQKLSTSKLLWLKDQSGKMWFGELRERNQTR